MTTGTTILQTQTVADSDSGWSFPLSFDQFDPSLGTLNQVEVGLLGDVGGSAAFENLGAAAATAQLELSSTIGVAAPDGTVLASVNPAVFKNLNLGAFDGTTDFAGASGTVVSGLSNVATHVSTFAAGPGVALPFVGTGSIDLTARGEANSILAAFGNLLSVTTGHAGATVSVQYDSTPASSGSNGQSSGSITTSSEVPGVHVNFAGEQTTAVQTLRIADATTGWNDVLAVNRFDSALGTLESVNLTLITDINGGLAIENLGSGSTSVALTDTANITLTLPGTIGVFTGTASINSSTELAGFDGTIDFAGLSGRDLTGLTNTGSSTAQFDAFNSDLSAFIGTGTVGLPVSAISPSTLVGPADLAAELLTEAGVTVEISYSYIPPDSPVPVVSSGSVPVISGTGAGQGVTDQTTVAPFANVVITDPNVGQTETVTVTLSNAANGTLTHLGGGSYNSGVYRDVGSAAAVTQAIQGLVFVPSSVAPGQTLTTGFTVRDVDTAGATTTDATTSVTGSAGVFIDTAAAAGDVAAALQAMVAPPTISGVVGGQAVSDIGTINPFAHVMIGDTNVFQTETVTVALSATANGTLTSLGGGSYDAATGVYTDVGSAAAVTAALQGLVFTPTAGEVPVGGTVTTGFTIGDIDTVSATATDNATSVVATGVAGDPEADILFQNGSGQLALWQIDSSMAATGGAIGLNPGSAWFAMGTGAFYKGDTSDVVLQNLNGAVAVWQMQGGNVVGGGIVAANPGPAWHIEGTGDFYGDGNTDILWQNDNGSVALWDMNGTTIVASGVVSANPGPAWHVVGTGDFYGDGNADILWQNDNGQVALWDMKGTSIVKGGVVSADPGSGWHVKGTGDFYGDGNTDILLQNDNGQVAIWDMKGTSIVQGGLAPNPGSDWHVEATGDFNSDGKADIVWRNDNGSVAIWEMNGTTITGGGVMANPGTSWTTLGSDQNMRFIYSTSANETLAAAPTTRDEFVFTSFAAGVHSITGFSATQDVIALSGAQFANFAAVQAATTAVPGGAMINLGHSSSLLLPGVDPTSLHASNFALA